MEENLKRMSNEWFSKNSHRLGEFARSFKDNDIDKYEKLYFAILEDMATGQRAINAIVNKDIRAMADMEKEINK